VFLGTVHDIVSRGGRCLIPVFALGRAQELLLILGTLTVRIREACQALEIYSGMFFCSLANHRQRFKGFNHKATIVASDWTRAHS